MTTVPKKNSPIYLQGKKLVFHQDNALSHTSKIVIEKINEMPDNPMIFQDLATRKLFQF